MGKALKCDRCGLCFDPKEQFGLMTRFRNPIFQDSNAVMEGTVSGKMIPDADSDYIVDLCPSCTTGFIIFMNNSDERDDDRK